MSDEFKKNFKFHNKVMVFRDKPSFGSGVVRIMELVKRTGKLSEAYRIMGLSSSKGWKLIKRAEEDLGFPLFVSVVGGSGGGYTQLSRRGEDYLNRYKSFVAELDIEAEKIFTKYFNE